MKEDNYEITQIRSIIIETSRNMQDALEIGGILGQRLWWKEIKKAEEKINTWCEKKMKGGKRC